MTANPDLNPERSVSEFIFFEGERGPLFTAVHRPATASDERGTVLCIQPFAEELNKCRRMITLQARALAALGMRVMVMDPYGCGDSAGRFEEGDWQLWLRDYAAASRWLMRETSGPCKILGVRLGAVMSVELVQAVEGISALVLWQPVLEGATALTDILRVRLVGEMLGGGERSRMKDLKARLLSTGEFVEVAGYVITPILARQLEEARLWADKPPRCPVHWLEVVRDPDSELGAAGGDVISTWTDKGCRVRRVMIAGPKFWNSSEVVDCPPLLDATREAFDG